MDGLFNIRNIIIFLGIAIMLYQVAMFNLQKDRLQKSSITTLLVTGLIGFVTNFLDFFGIGSFAPQTFLLTRLNIVKKEEEIPGTLNLANIVPIVIEAVFFITVFDVNPIMLVVLVLSAAFGSYFGAKLVSKENAPIIKKVVGYLMIVAGIILILKARQVGPFADIASKTELTGMYLAIGAVSFIILGALQSIGLGLYAPGFAILGLLGLSGTIILPVNMVASVALMTAAAPQFYKTKQYNYNSTITIMVAGILATLTAGAILKSIGSAQIDKIIPSLTIIIAIIIIIDGIFKITTKEK
jgi:uncharacterized membrane protein YfcA